MKLNLITLQTVKAQLSITTTDNDSVLTALIPIVSADIRRILNNQYSRYFSAVVYKDKSQIYLPDYSYQWPELPSFLQIGTVIQHDNLPDDCYITGYDQTMNRFSLSAEPLIGDGVSGVYVYPTVNVSQWPTISKMIWYKLKQQSVDFDTQDIVSESIGGMSFSYANTEIDKRYDYPSKLIKDLGTPYARIS